MLQLISVLPSADTLLLSMNRLSELLHPPMKLMDLC